MTVGSACVGGIRVGRCNRLLNRREVEELGFALQDHRHRLAESRVQRPGIIAFADLDLEWIERNLVRRQPRRCRGAQREHRQLGPERVEIRCVDRDLELGRSVPAARYARIDSRFHVEQLQRPVAQLVPVGAEQQRSRQREIRGRQPGNRKQLPDFVERRNGALELDLLRAHDRIGVQRRFGERRLDADTGSGISLGRDRAVDGEGKLADRAGSVRDDDAALVSSQRERYENAGIIPLGSAQQNVAVLERRELDDHG